MTLPVIVIRPEPGAQATCASALAQGLDARSHPLFTVAALAWEPPARSDIDALLLGSANALRHGGPALDTYRGMAAYAVGEKTAQAARKAGLDVIATGRGGLQYVLARLRPEHRRLLRLAGRERVDLTLPAAVTMTTCEVYASRALPIPAGLAALLAMPAVVLLHSGEAAAHFAGECARLGLARNALHLAAIGPRVAARAGEGWATLRSADTPDDTALLALARHLCQEAGQGSATTDQKA